MHGKKKNQKKTHKGLKLHASAGAGGAGNACLCHGIRQVIEKVSISRVDTTYPTQ